MAKGLLCSSAGFLGCNYTIVGKDEAEVLAKAAEHIQAHHGLTPKEIEGMGDKLRSLITDQPAA